MPASPEQLQKWVWVRQEVIDNKNVSVIGLSKAFKKLAARCAKHGYKPCSSLVCKEGVLPVAMFCKNAKSSDGLMLKCKTCDNDPVVAAASRERKQATGATLRTTTVFDAVGVEDEAREYLIAELKERGVEAVATSEFRLADVAVRLSDWPAGMWLRVQLKANGLYKKHGKTPKPNNRSHPDNGGGRAAFAHCNGYDGLLMVFVKSRLDANKQIERSIWCCNGDAIGGDQASEHVDGTLGTKKVPLGSIEKLVGAIEASTLPRMTLEAIDDEITLKTQRKEATIMRAIQATGKTVEFPFGNQTSVDCHVDGVATQVKTYDPKSRAANAKHRVNGKKGQPYTAADGVDQLVEGVIVKSGETFYLLHAKQPLDALLYNGVFGHTEPYRGHAPAPGKGTISLPLGIYSEWVTGEPQPSRKCETTAWLTDDAFGFRPPVEIVPGAHGIPPEWLEEAAWVAKNPAALPTPAVLEAHQERVDARDAELAAVSSSDPPPKKQKLDEKRRPRVGAVRQRVKSAEACCMRAKARLLLTA